MKNEIIQHFLKTIRGSDNSKRKHLTDLKERRDVVCKEVRRDNGEKRRIEEENRKKVLEKALEALKVPNDATYDVTNRLVVAESMKVMK